MGWRPAWVARHCSFARWTGADGRLADALSRPVALPGVQPGFCAIDDRKVHLGAGGVGDRGATDCGGRGRPSWTCAGRASSSSTTCSLGQAAGRSSPVVSMPVAPRTSTTGTRRAALLLICAGTCRQAREGRQYSCRALRGPGWEDRRPWPSRFSTWRSGLCWWHSFAVAVPGRQGHRAGRPAPRARGPPSPSGAAEAWRRGPCPARGGGVPAAALRALRAAGHPAHVVALASGARAPKVAAAARPARTPTHADRRAGPGAAAGTGESALGPSANHRRARQTRLPGVAIDRPSAARPRRTRTGSTEVRPGLARVVRTQAASIIACDLFTVESVFLRRYYALIFIAHATRRVWLVGCSTKPTGAWVTQQARNLGLEFADEACGS